MDRFSHPTFVRLRFHLLWEFSDTAISQQAIFQIQSPTLTSLWHFIFPILFFFFFLYLKGSSMIHRVKKRWSLGELCEPGSRFRLLLWYQNSITSSNSKRFPLFFSWVWTLLPDIFILNSRRFPSFRGVITCGHLTLRIHGCCNM